MKLERTTSTLDELSRLVTDWKAYFSPNSLTGLSGDLGSGKTTFIGELIYQLGTSTPASSPTYVLQHVYPTEAGEVHHWDLYRVSGAPEELFEALHDRSGTRVFVEWPEKDSTVLGALDFSLSIETLEGQSRRYVLIKHER